MFPSEKYANSIINRLDNLGNLLLGLRVYRDQTVMEYLIEFLQVFCSVKDREVGKNSAMRFHTPDELERDSSLPYWVDVRMGLRRFIFYAQSKQEGRSPIDDQAYEEIEELLTESEGAEQVAFLHDLLYSYTVVAKRRGWYAKALLPVCPALILPEAQGITKRKRMEPVSVTENSDAVDWNFDFKQFNFLGRGGQILYLHLLQALQEREKQDPGVRSRLEGLLNNALGSAGDIQRVAEHIQKRWVDIQDADALEGGTGKKTAAGAGDENRIDGVRYERFTVGYIPDAYDLRSERFLDEVTTFLRAEIHPVMRIELLAQGMVLALLRVIHITAVQEIDRSAPEPVWIMDVSGEPGTATIPRLAARSYKDAYNAFPTAMNHLYDRKEWKSAAESKPKTRGRPAKPKTRDVMVRNSWADTCDLFKNLGKQIRLIIPPKGNYERFTLSEPLVRYLVLALVEPGTKITYDAFLRRLWEHFGMVIGTEQFQKAIRTGQLNAEETMVDYFKTNSLRFQDFIKQCGFLRKLSDATSIVENPYQEVKIP